MHLSSLTVTCSEDLPGDLSIQFLHCPERREDDASRLEPGPEAVVSTYSRKKLIITLFHESDMFTVLFITTNYCAIILYLKRKKPKLQCCSVAT